ncbi:MAG: alcohol dehydrogenase catalytic domain-containing protein [Acidimicrobiia bacterium]|nr:alcohol dehydrogenase catalytic domain-containing protein [Acidimicrobiia bacterium]
MRAAVLEAFGAPLAIRDVADPALGAGEVLVRTGASGICRTDLKIIDGAVPSVTPPLILGHELAGEVAALGPGVDSVDVGARVVVGLDVSCGVCGYCARGQLDHCDRLGRLGIEHDGSLAELVCVPATNLVDIPDAVSFAHGAAIPDAVASPYHAVIGRARVRPGQTVAVYGLGGLGLVAVQIAALAGARVIAIARTATRRSLAQSLGAKWSIDPSGGDVSVQIRDLTQGLGVHAFIDLVGIDGSVEQGVLSCRKGGCVVVVGYSVPELSAGMMTLVYNEVSIIGSRGSTRGELIEAAALVGDGRIVPVIGAEMPLADVNDGLNSLREGSIIGRAVVMFR